jgi:hypothetical protein
MKTGLWARGTNDDEAHLRRTLVLNNNIEQDINIQS